MKLQTLFLGLSTGAWLASAAPTQVTQKHVESLIGRSKPSPGKISIPLERNEKRRPNYKRDDLGEIMLEDLGSDVAYKAQIEIGTLAQTFKVNVDTGVS